MNYIEEELRRQKVLLWELASLGRAKLPDAEEANGQERILLREKPEEHMPRSLGDTVQKNAEQEMIGRSRGIQGKTETGSRRSAAHSREENTEIPEVLLSLTDNAGGGNAAASAREVSVACERDARRYDGGYALY